MRMTAKVMLLGVVGKKGSGKFDDGREWSTDRVELHCLQSLPVNDPDTFGDTVTVYNVDGRDANFDRAKGCIGQHVELDMELAAPKKIGGKSQIIIHNFKPVKKAG